MPCLHGHQERFCPACANGSRFAPHDYSRTTVRAIAQEKKRVAKRKKEVLSLRQQLDSLERTQLEMYHTILQNERLAALDTLRQYSQDANVEIQEAKDLLDQVMSTNANKGYFGVAKLKEQVEAANQAVYRLRSEVTAASAELLQVIALEDAEPEPEPQTSPVKRLTISNRGDIDITFDPSQQQPPPPQYSAISTYGSVNNTPSRFSNPPVRALTNSAHQIPMSPIMHPYNRSSFGRSPATDRFLSSSPSLRKHLPSHRLSRAVHNPSGSVGYNVHEATDPLMPKGYTIPGAAESPGQSPRLRNAGADRSYQPEAYESTYDRSLMRSRYPPPPPPPPPPRPRSPVRNLHISNRGDIDITMEQQQLPPPLVGSSPWRSGGGDRAGAPASSMAASRGAWSTPRRPRPADFNRSVNESIRSSGPVNQSIFYDAPAERTSPVGAEQFNRRYSDSVAATGL